MTATSLTGMSNTATAYQRQPTRHSTRRRSSCWTPGRPSVSAVTANADPVTPNAMPGRIHSDGVWVDAEKTGTPRISTGVHNSQEIVYARTKNDVRGRSRMICRTLEGNRGCDTRRTLPQLPDNRAFLS